MDKDLTIWLHNNPYKNKTEAKPHSDAILQQLLQNTLNTSKPITIFKNKNGKPYVNEPIYFSHANSKNLYAYVISTVAEVAVDVEFIKPERHFMRLAQRYFHDLEIKWLSGLEPQAKPLNFFQLWTQKEAWCKLEGGNLWSYLNRSVLSRKQLINQEGNLIYMNNNSQIAGFTCTTASTQQFNRTWINNIA